MNYFRKKISFFLILFLQFQVYGQEYHSNFDSLNIVFKGYDQFAIAHIIEPDQSIYSITKHYGLKVFDITEWNKKEKLDQYFTGDTLYIPLPLEAIRVLPPAFEANQDYQKVFYKTKKGETLYHLGNRVFKQEIDSLAQRNQLVDYQLKNNQLLHIGWIARNGIPEELQSQRFNIQSKENTTNYKLFVKDKDGQSSLQYEHGSAEKLSQNKARDLVCLHNNSERGDIIKVVNPMNGSTLYLKVIGPIPAHFDRNIKIVLPEYASKLLGAIDERFYVHIFF